MDYGEVLERAWQITWRFKGLWVLGVLASCRGGGGGGSGSGGNFSGSFGPNGGGPDFPEIERFIETADPAIIVGAVAAVLAILLLLALVFFLMGVFGQAGLLYGADRADRGEHVSLAQAASGGLDFFWRLLALELMVFAVALVVGLSVIVAIVLFGILTLGVGVLLLLPLLCLFIPLSILFGLVLQIYLQFVRTSIVVDSLSITEALRRAWNVVKEHPVPAGVMGLILVLGAGIVGLILGLPLFFVLLPIIGGVAMGTDASLGLGIGFAALCCLTYFPFYLLLNGILQTYVQSGWTLTYRRITDRSGEPLAGAEVSD